MTPTLSIWEWLPWVLALAFSIGTNFVLMKMLRESIANCDGFIDLYKKAKEKLNDDRTP